MPVFDIYAVARSAARFFLYLALVGFIISVSFTIFNILETASLMVNNVLDSVNTFFNSINNLGGSSSCLGYFVSGLGIDVVLTSFFASAFSLLLFYVGSLITLYSIQLSLYLKRLAIEAIR